jgi:hypothetical protein
MAIVGGVRKALAVLRAPGEQARGGPTSGLNFHFSQENSAHVLSLEIVAIDREGDGPQICAPGVPPEPMVLPWPQPG